MLDALEEATTDDTAELGKTIGWHNSKPYRIATCDCDTTHHVPLNVTIFFADGKGRALVDVYIPEHDVRRSFVINLRMKIGTH